MTVSENPRKSFKINGNASNPLIPMDCAQIGYICNVARRSNCRRELLAQDFLQQAASQDTLQSSWLVPSETTVLLQSILKKHSWPNSSIRRQA